MTAHEMFEALGWWQKDKDDKRYSPHAWYKCPVYAWGIDYDNPYLILFDEKTQTADMYWRYEEICDYWKTETSGEVKPAVAQRLRELGWPMLKVD